MHDARSAPDGATCLGISIMDAPPRSPYSDLEKILGKVSSERRALVLRHVTELFLEAAASCSPRQIAMFDAIMQSLARNIDRMALSELSGKLAMADSAPANILSRLSHDDDIAIAGVILEKSRVLGDDQLIEIAMVQSQAHLYAIAGREQITIAVSDVLVDRGNVTVMRRVAGNGGASLSDVSFCKLVTTAHNDTGLAETVANRPDLPPELRPFLEMPPKVKAAVNPPPKAKVAASK